MLAALQRAWLRRGVPALLLLPMSALYGALTRIHRLLHRTGVLHSSRVARPVLIVGNVVAGGAGKTPVVMALVEHFRARGIETGVVSRGHGRNSKGSFAVTASSDPDEVGDEPHLIATRCRVPVFVARRRADAARALLAAHPGVQLVLSDDGLQHHALHRDVEVCVFDDRGIGNGWLLPAGPLREPWPRAVDLVLRTPGAVGIDGFTVHRRLAGFAYRADGRRADLQELSRSPCDALAGIARPEAFFAMLRTEGVELGIASALPDHHDFKPDRGWARAGIPLLCTEKDAFKLWRLEPQAWAVPLALDIEAGFWEALDARLGPKLSSPHGFETA